LKKEEIRCKRKGGAEKKKKKKYKKGGREENNVEVPERASAWKGSH